MKIKNISGMLLGTVVVYVAMAACSATDHIKLPSASNSGTGGTGGSGDVSTASGMGGMIGMGGAGGSILEDAGGMMDALMDPVPDASADPVSGTRLKAKYMKADDGARAPLADVWHDSQRNEECRFQLASDGKQRCLPTSYSYISYYADAACTQPLVHLVAGCSPPKYGVDYGTSSCNYAFTHYSVGSQAQPAQVYLKSGASCISTPANAAFSYFSVGSKIAPTSFVAGVVEIDP